MVNFVDDGGKKQRANRWPAHPAFPGPNFNVKEQQGFNPWADHRASDTARAWTERSNFWNAKKDLEGKSGNFSFVILTLTMTGSYATYRANIAVTC